MMQKPPVLHENVLLKALPSTEYRQFVSQAERVTLDIGDVIADSESRISHVYFPLSCVLSVLSVMTDRSAIETAVVGPEGMAPLAAFHGTPSAAEQIIVQVPGEALRMPVDVFRQTLPEWPALRESLHRFCQSLFTFAAQSSGCNRMHSIIQRCARWLLVLHDRAPGDDFPVTHVLLAQMLGVRRASVTVAAEVLRERRAIDYSRGRMRIVDRARLRASSCDCYDVIRSTYDRLIERLDTPSPLAELTLSVDGRSITHEAESDRTLSEQGSGATMSDDALSSFSEQVMFAQQRGDALRERILHAPPGLDPGVLVASEDLDVALEQLHVAEAELRAQVEAMEEMRNRLEYQEHKLRGRFDALPDAFIETDQNDIITEVNRAAEELLGRTRHRLIGQSVQTLVPLDQRRGLRNVISSLRADGERARWTGAFIGAGNTKANVEVSVAVTRAGVAGESTFALALVRKRSGQYLGAQFLLRRSEATRSERRSVEGGGTPPIA